MRCMLRVLLFLAAFLPSTIVTAGPVTKVVVFGDSLSDPGNLYAASGETDPMSPPYYNGRFSNGPIWVDYFQDSYGIAVESHAYGGATTGAHNIANQTPGQYPGLQQQMQGWAAAHPAGADPDAIYFIWAGSNDFSLLPPAPTPGEIENFFAQTIGNILTAVGTAYAAGAQNVVVGNIPDLGLTPGAQMNGISDQLSELTRLFNLQLAAELGNFFADAAILDSYDMLSDIIANAAQFGITNTSMPCLTRDAGGVTICDDPSAYLFWDDMHPTTLAHRLFADYFAANVLPLQVAEPAMGGLVAVLALVAMAGARRRSTLILRRNGIS